MAKIARNKIALIGASGSGKTTVAAQARSLYGATVIDTDDVFECRNGSIADFFSGRGEAAFRLAEREIVVTAAESDCDIIACGGGAVCDAAAMCALRKHCDIVWLYAPTELLKRRIERSDRPLKNEIEKLIEQRTPLYKRYADYAVSTNDGDALSAVLKAVEKPRKNRYDILLCDADDTVLDFDRAMRYSILTAARAMGINAPDEDIVREYRIGNDKLWEQLEKGEITRAKLDAVRFSVFAERMGISIDTWAMNDAYLTAMKSTRFVLDGATEFLSDVRSRGIKVYIATNSFERIASERLKAVEKYVDGSFIAERIGYDKPDKRFFDEVLKKLGADDRSRVLVFGDGVSSDIAGGKNSGIDTCLYDPNGIKTSDAEYTVRSYAELCKIL